MITAVAVCAGLPWELQIRSWRSAMSGSASPHPISGWLLARGLPRDPHASPHLTAMLVSAVATVLLVRGFLAAAGYPQIGGGGLHIAHVLWGGLLMVLGLVLLLSFAGPVIRP